MITRLFVSKISIGEKCNASVCMLLIHRVQHYTPRQRGALGLSEYSQHTHKITVLKPAGCVKHSQCQQQRPIPVPFLMHVTHADSTSKLPEPCLNFCSSHVCAGMRVREQCTPVWGSPHVLCLPSTPSWLFVFLCQESLTNDALVLMDNFLFK